MNVFLHDMMGIIKSFGFWDFCDIVIVAYLIYHVIRLLRDTRAIQIIKGIAILGGVYALAALSGMRSLEFLIRYVFQYGALAIFVMFQPELRRSLEKVGGTRFSSLQLFNNQSTPDELNQHWNTAITSITEAASYLSKRRIGALIVLERRTLLGEIINTGTVIDAAPSSEMIGNIFFPNSPLHDGALVIRAGRLVAAGCFLPLSDNFTISKEMGTRHRAGLGMSEISDAVVVIISEETGIITVAENGKLRRGFTEEQLERELKGYFIQDKREDKPEFITNLSNLLKVKK